MSWSLHARKAPADFGRERRLPLPQLVAFPVNAPRSAQQSELDTFFGHALGSRRHLRHLGPQDPLLIDRGDPSRDGSAKSAAQRVAFCARISERTGNAVARFPHARSNDAVAGLGTPGEPFVCRLLRANCPAVRAPNRLLHHVIWTPRRQCGQEATPPCRRLDFAYYLSNSIK